VIGTDHTYNIATFRALYRVANASGDNWFEGDAGNFSVTGHENFGTGQQCMLGLTTGYGNTGVGSGCMTFLTTGFNNFAFGTNTLRSGGPSSYNVAIGPAALQTGTNLTGNVAIGQNAMPGLGASGTACTYNVSLGTNALGSLSTGDNNVGLGYNAGQNMSNANDTVCIGGFALGFAAGAGNDYTTAIGARAGFLLAHAVRSTIIGRWSATNISVSDIIAINQGDYNTAAVPALDYNFTNNHIWSFHQLSNAQGLHVYNTFDDATPTVNYERAIFDWNVASNVLTIGTQAGGTGVQRNIAIGGFPKAGAPAASDLPTGTFSLIDDTSGGATWLVFNKAGTIRKVQLT